MLEYRPGCTFDEAETKLEGLVAKDKTELVKQLEKRKPYLRLNQHSPIELALQRSDIPIVEEGEAQEGEGDNEGTDPNADPPPLPQPDIPSNQGPPNPKTKAQNTYVDPTKQPRHDPGVTQTPSPTHQNKVENPKPYKIPKKTNHTRPNPHNRDNDPPQGSEPNNRQRGFQDPPQKPGNNKVPGENGGWTRVTYNKDKQTNKNKRPRPQNESDPQQHKKRPFPHTHKGRPNYRAQNQ